MTYIGDNVYDVNFSVTSPGYYVIVVKWDNFELTRQSLHLQLSDILKCVVFVLWCVCVLCPVVCVCVCVKTV